MIVEIGVVAFVGALTYVSGRMKGAADKERASDRARAQEALNERLVFEAEAAEERSALAPAQGGLSRAEETSGAVSRL